MQDIDFVQKALELALGKPVRVENVSSVSGGSINHTLKVSTTGNNTYFLKWNRQSDMFEKEAIGLEYLRKTQTIAVPDVLGAGNTDGKSFLVMRFIEQGRRKDSFWESFGENLARLHKSRAEKYGLETSNYIGSLKQANEWQEDWVVFFIEKRLMPQLELARNTGKIDHRILQQFDMLFGKLSAILPKENPALVHGDLWSGNFMTDESGDPVLIDPAIYYGNREVDLAMSRLFGGFDDRFYEAYLAVWPAEKGLEERMDIYNLYPLLVHVNLFGGGYLTSVKSIISRF